jgi:hypothetical protein
MNIDVFCLLTSNSASMPRKLRVEYEGAIYHLINRGDHREDIFRDHKDRERFLETLGEACERTGWQVHSYCLMPNHFHLVVETPRPNLSGFWEPTPPVSIVGTNSPAIYLVAATNPCWWMAAGTDT